MKAIHSDIDSMPISLANFESVLEKFMSDGRCNGFRVYFAAYSEEDAPSVPPDRGGKLTILFVPTIGKKGEEGGKNDEARWYHLYGDDIMDNLPARGTVPLGEDLVTIWTNNYVNYMVPKLEKDGKEETANDKFAETRSLWYSKLSISGGEEGDNEIGLLRFITCGMNYKPNRIVDLTVFFAAFMPKAEEPEFPFDYQLTVTFNLRQEKDPVDKEEALAFGSGRLPDRAAPADTGLPCPPKGNCPVQNP